MLSDSRWAARTTCPRATRPRAADRRADKGNYTPAGDPVTRSTRSALICMAPDAVGTVNTTLPTNACVS